MSPLSNTKLVDPTTDETLLSALEKQRRYVLTQVALRPERCPNCLEPVNIIEAAGVALDDFDFGHTRHDYKCPHCLVEIVEVVPMVAVTQSGYFWERKNPGPREAPRIITPRSHNHEPNGQHWQDCPGCDDVVKLEDLTPPQQRVVRALIDAAKTTCQGYTSDDGTYAQAPHEVDALAHSYSTSPDKDICRACYAAYVRDWRARSA